jgi:mRNA-degrading endonuclease RelE of RelBE toxin-antitoxin system
VIYAVRFSSEAEKELSRLDQTLRRRVIQRAELLSADPYNRRLGKPLKNTDRLRSSRIGAWRILYQVAQRETTGEVQIVAIAHAEALTETFKFCALCASA